MGGFRRKLSWEVFSTVINSLRMEPSAFADMLEQTQAVDRLGYLRVTIPEHHRACRGGDLGCGPADTGYRCICPRVLAGLHSNERTAGAWSCAWGFDRPPPILDSQTCLHQPTHQNSC